MTILIFWLSQYLGPKAAKVAVWAILACVILAALGVAKCTYDANVIDDYSAKVEAADKQADFAGAAKAQETKGRIDNENAQAKDAADGSDDPLASGFDSLREQSKARRD